MEDDTPVVEDRLITDTCNMRLVDSEDSDKEESDHTDNSGGGEEAARGVSVPGGEARRSAEDGDMSQSYHEIFDTQPYSGRAAKTEQEREEVPKPVEVYYSEGEGRLVSVSPPPGCDQPPMSQYLTSKLVADSLMWQQTFRNDSPSPEEDQRPGTSLQRPTSLPASDSASSVATRAKVSAVIDPGVINHIEKEARRLATDVDALVENLSCVLQSLSGLTVEHVQTYRDGVCKTCDSVDSNIRAMYQLMAKWEELNKNMAPAYRISGQIKDIKRLLDLFEAALN